jgi:hypothetical protein
MDQPAPDWISFDADKTEGLDLLGLRAPVQQIGNQRFDGVTTVTPKLRYLSVLTWIIWRYSEARLPDAWQPFERFVEAQEAMIVLANRLKSRDIGNLVGVTKAAKLLDSGRRNFRLERLVQQIAFNVYVATSRQLHLTHDETDSDLAGLTKERGLRLARAFDAGIRDTTYGRQLGRRPTLDRASRDAIEELADAVFLDRIPREEREILIDAIMPQTPETEQERSRLAQYALLLWLARAKGEEPKESDIFDAARNVPHGLPRALVPVLNDWLEYIIRDVIAVTHESVFGAVMREVDVASAERGGPAAADRVIAGLLDEAEEHGAILRQLNLLSRNESAHEISFATLRERVHRACRDEESVSSGLRRWRAGLSEIELYGMAMASGRAAAVFLPVAWCLVAERIASELPNMRAARPRVLSIGRIFQIGLEHVILPKIEEFAREGRTLREVMGELTTRTVQQHLRVAWTRFAPPQGKDVSVLIADNDTWARNNGFKPGRTDSRLWVAISWLNQLRLTDEDGLTASGRRVLERSLAALSRGQA